MHWCRDVEDIFTVWHDKWGSFEQYFNQVNSLVPSIKFKVKWKTEWKLPFLNIMIMRVEMFLEFTVYRKLTHLGRHLHIFRNHPQQIVKSVVSGILYEP